MLCLADGQYLTISWETVVSIVAPMVGAGVWMAKWMASRSDRDRDDLMKRMDADRLEANEDRKVLKETLHALKNAIQAATLTTESHEQTVSSMVQTQQRIVWTQERILALIEADLRKLKGDVRFEDRQKAEERA